MVLQRFLTRMGIGRPGVGGNRKVTEILEDTAPGGRFPAKAHLPQVGSDTGCVPGSPACWWRGLRERGREGRLCGTWI